MPLTIPDIIVTDPAGSPWLLRAPQLIVSAPHNGGITATVDFALHPVRSVVDGVAAVLPVEPSRAAKTYSLADLPADLAQGVATWLATEAAAQGPGLFASILAPAQEPAP
jgi:hypothetical protein